MSEKKKQSFLGFTRIRKVRSSDTKDNLGNLFVAIFFGVIIFGVALKLMQDNPFALILIVAVIACILALVTYRKIGYEDEIAGMVHDLTGNAHSQVFIADTISRYPKVIQIIPGRVMIWVIKHGIPVKFIESTINSSTSFVVHRKRSFIPFLYYRGVTLIDQETKQSYTVVPHYRVTKFNILPDTDGKLSKRVVDSIKESGYSGMSFDEL